MKKMNKRLFVITLIAMSLITVSSVFAGVATNNSKNDDPGKSDYELPTYELVGCVTAVYYRTIVIDDLTVIKTPIAWTLPQVNDVVWIEYWVNADGVKVICDMEIL